MAQRGVIWILCGLMALIWRYALVNFMMSLLFHKSYLLLVAVCAFCLPMAIYSFIKGRGWRIIYIIGLHALGIAATSLLAVYLFGDRAYGLLNTSWLAEFIYQSKNGMEWFYWVVVFLNIIVFWIGGILLINKPIDYIRVCNTFDTGVLFFLFLYILKYVLAVQEVQEEIIVNDPISANLFWPFLLFGVMAIAKARTYTQASREFKEGYNGIGIILSFTSAILLLGTSIYMLFRPFLHHTAELGYAVLKAAAEPLGPIIIKILTFSVQFRYSDDKAPAEGSSSLVDEVGNVSWDSIVMHFFTQAILIISVTAVAFGVLSLIWFILRWLFSKQAVDPKPFQPRNRNNILALFWAWLYGIWYFCCAFIGLNRYGPKEIYYFYEGLLTWGRRSGLRAIVSETPAEYGRRLAHYFPVVKAEIGLIVDIFNRHVYGQTATDNEQLDLAHGAWRKLHNPFFWIKRFKVWYFYSGAPSIP
ncbi:DUF4129 domain-containing protein [Thermodesulfobacteriota bacterium]